MWETLEKYGYLMRILSDKQLGKVMRNVIDCVYDSLNQPDDFLQTVHRDFNGDTACEIIFNILITEML